MLLKAISNALLFLDIVDLFLWFSNIKAPSRSDRATTNAPVLYISIKCRPVSPCLILKARKKAMTTTMISRTRKSECLSQLGDFFLYKPIAPFLVTGLSGRHFRPDLHSKKLSIILYHINHLAGKLISQ